MTIAEIKQITSNKLASLRLQQAQAIHDGDLELVSTTDSQITETEITLIKLDSIQ